MGGKSGGNEGRTGNIMILVDTTVWIDFFADRDTNGTQKLLCAVNGEEDLATCGLVMTEVLQGVREDRRFSEVKTVLQDLIYLPVDQTIFIAAAEIYRACRKKGLTIRKPVDCIIAATCIQHSSFLLHNDRFFDAVSKIVALRAF